MFPDPVFISLYILVFVFFWIIVCGIISYLSGWYKFSRNNAFPEKVSNEIAQFPYSSVQINHFGSYNNALVIKIYKEGISISPQLLFRAFHKPIFIKWNQILKTEQGTEFIWFAKTDIYTEGNKFRFYGKASASINGNYLLYKQS